MSVKKYSLEGAERQILGKIIFDRASKIKYLNPNMERITHYELKAKN